MGVPATNRLRHMLSAFSCQTQQQKDRGLTWNPAKLNFPKVKRYNLWPWQCFTRLLIQSDGSDCVKKRDSSNPCCFPTSTHLANCFWKWVFLLGCHWVSWSNKYRSTQSHHPSSFDFRKVWVDQFSDINWPSGKHYGWSYWQLKVATDKKKTHPKLNSKKLS